MNSSKCKFLLTIAFGVVLAVSSSVMAQAPAPVAIYALDGDRTDSLGGPDILPNGGTLSATGYSFGANEGLSLVGVINPTDYSIEMVFQVENVDVAKIIDFENLASDSGYYAGNYSPNDGNLMFFDASIPGAGVPGTGPNLGPGMVLNNDVDAHLVITRSGTTGQAVAYVNCVEHIRFNTVNGVEATFSEDVSHFFIDDVVTGQVEGRAGFVDYIKIYDGALTPSEVATLAGDTGDNDCDGVANYDDFCPDTALPESVPEVILKPEHWALTDGNVKFDTTTMGKGKGPGRHYTTADTAGCSCEQIIEEQGLGDGHSNFGCSIGVMDNWVKLVNP